MWGERGLVATFFQDCSTAGDIRRWETLFNSCDPPSLSGPLDRIWAVIEPDFGQFGHPDVVVHLTFSDGQEAVLFVEAKRGTYVHTSRVSTQRALPGFNSSLNGQIELNYRLSLALADFLPEIPGPLSEPDWMLRTPYLPRHPGRPRYLKKPAVLRDVIEAGKLFGSPSNRYFHLAITSDRVNPFANKDLEAQRPCILASDGSDQWHKMRQQFMWINWETINALTKQWPPSSAHQHFPATFALNRSDLERDAISGGGAIPSGRSTQGVSMVRLRRQLLGIPITDGTFVHFSWKKHRACLRDYSVVPRAERELPTQEVMDNLVKEVPYTQGVRQPFSNDSWWRNESIRLRTEHNF